ncbi:MAG: DUF1553 domain-containing protein [Planctomycetales bacterium]|nr:DUF1553 domain-containing protein [Planctomycetales bacterium]
MPVSRLRLAGARLPLAFSTLSTLSMVALLAATLVAADGPKLKELSVFPSQATLAGQRTTQGLRATAVFEDGTRKDVTEQCQFHSSAPNVAAVSATGLITPQSNGDAQVITTLDGVETTTAITIQRCDDNSYNFRNDVLPVVEHLTCNQMGCHGSPKGKKRLQLSLFSADPHEDYRQLTDKEKKLVDPEHPDRSWMLLKAICEEDHGGGDLTEEGSPEYNLLLDWIKKGVPEGDDADPEIVRVEVFPQERRLLPGERQRLLVEAHYSDGSMRDVTDLASFKSDEEAVATADATGVIEATGYGEAVVMVSYSGRLTTCRVISSQPAQVPFPNIPVDNRVDELVLAKLKSLNIIPSDLCSDEEFARRVYLDVIGILPTADETRAFLADTSADKRAKLIDQLLERPEYADFYALKWGDVLQINRQEPARLQDKGMWAFYRWLWSSLDENKPMDQFVHDVLTARGSGYRNGPANFFRIGEGPQGMAEHASTAFLGVRLDCAHCHNHPFEQFTLNDNLGMAAFFTKVRTKRSSEQDEEIVYLADTGSIKNPDTNQVAAAKFLSGPELSAKERAASLAAADAQSAADREAAKLAAQVKSVVAKAASAKAAAAKESARLAGLANTAMSDVKRAQEAAQRAAGELAAAKAALATDATSKTEAEQEAAAKQMAEKEAAVEAANREADAARAKADNIMSQKADAERAAKQAESDSTAELKAVNAAKAAADRELAVKTRAAREAAAALLAAENEGDPRAKLAAWITSPDNPYFARHMANRVWTWLLGRGIIDEPDDFRSTNPASNPELLDFLADQFVKSGYDMKAMFRIVLNSRTYQLSAKPNQWNRHDQIHYSHARLKRLTAEQLATAITQVTGVDEKYPGLPLGTRATQLPDVSMRSEFLDLFGRPKRATPVESERTCDTHLGQSLQMISSDYVARKLRDNSGRVAKLVASGKTSEQIVEELYLTALGRRPTDGERELIFSTPIDDKLRREKFEDLAWVLMNTKEFLFNH